MSLNIKMDFPAIQTRLTDEEIGVIARALKTAGTLTMGPLLHSFEENFARYLGVKHAFGVANATCALELSAMVSGIREGDEVIVPAHTFMATALPFMRRRAKLVFADIDPATFVMDIDDVRRKITSRTRALVPVHLYGLPVDMGAVMDMAEECDLVVIEDCAQSPGAEFNSRKTGAFGDTGCFSFHSQKNITTLGEGGMIVTNNDYDAERILGLRKIGQRPFPRQDRYWLPAMSNVVEAVPGELPYNFALGEIQALAGDLLLKRLDELNARRRSLKQRIESALSHHEELRFQHVPENRLSACHLLPARFDGGKIGKTRDDLIELLYGAFGIKCVVQYYPLYRYDLFRKNGYNNDGSCPQTDLFFDNMISFPFSSDMTDADIDYLIHSIDLTMFSLKGKPLEYQKS